MAKRRMINQYYKHLDTTKEREGDDQNAYYERNKLSRSTLEKIKSVCVARTRKTSLGMDNYVYLGVESIDKLVELLDQAVQRFAINKEWVLQKKKEPIEAKSYIKTDFRVHLQSSSHVAKHHLL